MTACKRTQTHRGTHPLSALSMHCSGYPIRTNTQKSKMYQISLLITFAISKNWSFSTRSDAVVVFCMAVRFLFLLPQYIVCSCSSFLNLRFIICLIAKKKKWNKKFKSSRNTNGSSSNEPRRTTLYRFVCVFVRFVCMVRETCKSTRSCVRTRFRSRGNFKTKKKKKYRAQASEQLKRRRYTCTHRTLKYTEHNTTCSALHVAYMYNSLMVLMHFILYYYERTVRIRIYIYSYIIYIQQS